MDITQRSLEFGPHRLAAADAGVPTPYFLAGRRMYAVGWSDGAVRPVGAEHLAGQMGGLWAHPLKVADGLTLQIDGPDGAELPPAAAALVERLSYVEWRYGAGALRVRRRDLIAEDEPAFVALLELHNPAEQPQRGALRLRVWLTFLGCWFGGLEAGGGVYWQADGTVLGYDRHWPERWGVAFGAERAPAAFRLAERPGGHIATLVYPFELAPGQTARWEFLLAADHQRGHTGAAELLGRLRGAGERLLAAKDRLYQRRALDAPALQTPDPRVDRAFALARANLQLLSADYPPDLPPYFLAGVPEYPQLFGCDTEYSVPGAAAAGFAPTARSALLALAAYARRACGRVPHEITTNGRVFHPGNTQETPQLAQACWDYLRWTGDTELLRLVYPLCREGVEQYLPALWGGGPHSPYPAGDGVVERQGMGARKLDSTCYLFQALQALAGMAEALDLPAEAARYQSHAAHLRARFEQDWWLEHERVYADSLHSDGRPQLDGHWTVVLPLQVGLAAEARARQSLERIEREWVNQWGLVHTRAREELVWTLPTGLLALAEFRHGRAGPGLRLLQNIAETASHGTLGAFKELIPIGLCFVQLWSAALYLQGVLEGLLGLAPLAHRHTLEIAPCLPPGWGKVRLSGLAVGAHTLDLRVAPGRLELLHVGGACPLEVRYLLPAGARLSDAHPAPAVRAQDGRQTAVFVLQPGEHLAVQTQQSGEGQGEQNVS